MAEALDIAFDNLEKLELNSDQYMELAVACKDPEFGLTLYYGLRFIYGIGGN